VTDTQSARFVADAIQHAVGSNGLPAVPHVAAHLGRFAQGDSAGIGEIARSLSDAQLRGESRIPDSLLVTPAIREAVANVITALSPAQRRLLLFAAIAVSDRADVLVEASGVDVGTLLDWHKPDVAIKAGRFSLRDKRVAAVVVAETNPIDLLNAHRALSKAFSAHGGPEYAAWHQFRGSRRGDPIPARALLDYARECLRAGNTLAAQTIAESIARQGLGNVGAHAEIVAASAALWGGFIGDAGEAARRAQRAGDEETTLAAQNIQDLIEDLHTPPSSPGQLLDRVVEQKTKFGEFAVSIADKSLFRIFAEADQLWYSARDEVDAAWARYVMTRPVIAQDWPWDPQSIALTPLAQAFECLVMITVQAQGVDPGAARTTLESALARLPLGVTFFGTVSSFVRELVEPEDAQVITASFEATAVEAPIARYFDETVVIGPRSTAAVQGMEDGPEFEPQLRSLSELTAREREVVELAKTGMSTAAIGEQLGISPRTVEIHLLRVYRKLGVRSRGELVALVLTPVSRRKP